MKFTKSQKIYSAALGLGVVALVYDRCFNDPKGPPRRAPVNASLAIDSHEVLISIPGKPLSPVESDIIDRLRQLQATLHSFPRVHDAFTPSSAWISVKERTGPSDRAIQFQSTHRLRAIFDTSSKGQAIVDDTLVAVGQSLDGFDLISVDHCMATFADGDARATLILGTTYPPQRAQQDP